MGLIHTPRTIVSIAKGLWKRRQGTVDWPGLGPDKPYVYNARLGLFDVDYLGHLNNAAYLSHAELARWELTAANGMLTSMLQSGTNFIVSGSCIRYRQEIRPVFRKFQVDTYVAGLDQRTIWMVQNFRYPGKNERIRAQMIVQGVAVQKTKGIIDPRSFFVDTVGMPSDLIESVNLPITSDDTVEDVLERYSFLEKALRRAATVDDELQKKEANKE
jgi:acyl-CoA thioesterase FadM